MCVCVVGVLCVCVSYSSWPHRRRSHSRSPYRRSSSWGCSGRWDRRRSCADTSPSSSLWGTVAAQGSHTDCHTNAGGGLLKLKNLDSTSVSPVKFSLSLSPSITPSLTNSSHLCTSLGLSVSLHTSLSLFLPSFLPLPLSLCLARYLGSSSRRSSLHSR